MFTIMSSPYRFPNPSMHKSPPKTRMRSMLSGPISRAFAIVSLQYPLSRGTFSAIPATPQQGAIPALGALFYTDISVRYPILQRIARYLCDTPGKQAPKSFAILSLKVSRDMKSIAAGPLRVDVGYKIYNLWCHLQRGEMPEHETAEKTPKKDASGVAWKVPKKFTEKSKKKSAHSCFSSVVGSSVVLQRAFLGTPPGTLLDCSLWPFCSWQQRL